MTTRSSATAVPGRPDPDRDPERGPLLGGERRAEAVVVGPAQVAGGRVEQVEDDAVGADEPPGMLDDVLEDLGRLAQDRDPGRDLAQGLLGLGASTERVARAIQLLDQARRRDGDRRLVGDRDEERRVRLVPGVRAARVDRQRAERSGLADEWRGHDRVDPDPADVWRRPACRGGTLRSLT